MSITAELFHWHREKAIEPRRIQKRLLALSNSTSLHTFHIENLIVAALDGAKLQKQIHWVDRHRLKTE
jgi:hypothetical protein